MDNNRKKPIIRFEEFKKLYEENGGDSNPENPYAWEQRKLGDMVEFFSGLTYSPDNVIKQPGTLVLRSSNVQNGEIVNADNVYVDNEVVNSDNVQVGDIAVVVRNGSRSLIGKHAAIKYPMKDTVIGAFMTGIRSDTSSFTNALLDTQQFETEIAKNLGATINQITTGNFKKMIFNFPEIDERLRIGDFFNQLDNTIALQQRKVEKILNLKKAMLEKMFLKDGEKIPEVRFEEFKKLYEENGGDSNPENPYTWEQRKLGEVVRITMGQSPNSANYTKNPQDYILVQGNADMKNSRVVPRVWTTQVTKQADKGDLILSVRAPVGDIGKTDYDVVIGRGVAAIKGNDFIFHQLGKMKEDGFWSRFSTGSTFESINSNDIREALITTPSEEEQQKIGTFFKQLDDTIALQQHKLTKLKNIKKSLLEKMFI